jgi:hypothetical protein
MTEQSKCRACCAPISWVKTPTGKWTPQNQDGSSHWATCNRADQFRKPKAPEGQLDFPALLAELGKLRSDAAIIKARIFQIQAQVSAAGVAP